MVEKSYSQCNQDYREISLEQAQAIILGAAVRDDKPERIIAKLQETVGEENFKYITHLPHQFNQISLR